MVIELPKSVSFIWGIELGSFPLQSAKAINIFSGFKSAWIKPPTLWRYLNALNIWTPIHRIVQAPNTNTFPEEIGNGDAEDSQERNGSEEP